ncbi:MAG: hypothetical protein SOR87_00255, partial [Vescimonas coprocola]|nr:hypothetical protein [Vescimonas coprocola]
MMKIANLIFEKTISDSTFSRYRFLAGLSRKRIQILRFIPQNYLKNTPKARNVGGGVGCSGQRG